MMAPEHPRSVLSIDWSSSGTDGPESLLRAHFLLLPDYLCLYSYHLLSITFSYDMIPLQNGCVGVQGFRLQHWSITGDSVLSLNRYLLDDEKQDNLSLCLDRHVWLTDNSQCRPSTVILKTPSCPMPEACCSTPLHPGSSQSVAMFEGLSHCFKKREYIVGTLSSFQTSNGKF